MSERDDNESWTDDFALGEGTFFHARYTIRLSVHQTEETYYDYQELFPRSDAKGTRRYFHARPYLLLPDLTVRVNLDVRPREGVVGEQLQSLGYQVTLIRTKPAA